MSSELLSRALEELGRSTVRAELAQAPADRLLPLATEVLRAQDSGVVDEHAYGWTRVLVDALGGADPVPYFPHVTLAQRDDVLEATRRAAVALPIVVDPKHGELVLVSRRSAVNGHTGGPMDNAGEIVLFGGSIEPGEPSVVAALRELGEEAGLPGVPGDLRFDAFEHLGDWVTEGGFRATGHLIRVVGDATSAVQPDAREVAAVGRLSLAELMSAPLVVRPHLRVGLGKGRVPRFVGWFDSPTVVVSDVDTGLEWELFGLAGAMAAQLRARYSGVSDIRLRLADRAARRARTVADIDVSSDIVLRAWRVRHLMTNTLQIGQPAVLRSELLSELLGEPSHLVLDAELELGGSSKARVVSGLVQAALEARAERTGHIGQSDLAELFAGVTLLAASTGSHARAIAALARWLRDTHDVEVDCEFFVSADIPAGKRAVLEEAGTVVLCSDFNAATGAAHARQAELGGRGVFLPCDPEETLNPAFGVSGMDGMAGFATLLMDVCAAVRVGELHIPTSGGATFASCATLLRRLGPGESTVDRLVVVYDAAAPCLPAALAAADAYHAVEVDWSRSINGLAQPQLAPGAYPLLAAMEVDARPVTTEAASVAQALIALETGLWPEPAGAAALGARLLSERDRLGAVFLNHLRELVADHPLRRHVPDFEERLADLAWSPVGGVIRPPSGAGSAYVVTGAAVPQSAELRDAVAREAR